MERKICHQIRRFVCCHTVEQTACRVLVLEYDSHEKRQHLKITNPMGARADEGWTFVCGLKLSTSCFSFQPNPEHCHR